MKQQKNERKMENGMLNIQYPMSRMENETSNPMHHHGLISKPIRGQGEGLHHHLYGGAGNSLCTGPPGRARSPGTLQTQFPLRSPDSIRKSDHPPDGL